MLFAQNAKKCLGFFSLISLLSPQFSSIIGSCLNLAFFTLSRLVGFYRIAVLSSAPPYRFPQISLSTRKKMPLMSSRLAPNSHVTHNSSVILPFCLCLPNIHHLLDVVYIYTIFCFIPAFNKSFVSPEKIFLDSQSQRSTLVN